jgi:autotransporter-associated beta strand protein
LLSANSYSGPTALNGGALTFSALNQLGSGTAINFGGGTLRYAASAANIDISSRTVTFNTGNGTIDTNGRDVTFANPVGNNGVGGLAKAGTGTLTLVGGGTYSGNTTVDAGTLLISGNLSATSGVTASSGTVKLGAADRLNDAARLTLANATFSSNGFNETLGVFALAGSASFDLGTGASRLHFAESSSEFWNGTLNVLNWSGSPNGGGTDQVFFGTSDAGIDAFQLSLITFVDPFGAGSGNRGARMLSTGELVAIPEPNSLGLAIGALSVFGLGRRRLLRLR